MRVEIVAVGTELLLGQIADTNAAWLGEQLAASGVDSHFHQAVGDNHARIVLALRTALARSDGVIVCGGLGPTQDDITREAIAEVMNVPLVRDEEIVARIAGFFGSRGREMSANNARQADVPEGASVIEQVQGTAPGLVRPLGRKQGELSMPPARFVERFDLMAPRFALPIIDLAQIQNRTLHHTTTRTALAFHNAPVTVLLAVLPSPCESQVHGPRF